MDFAKASRCRRGKGLSERPAPIGRRLRRVLRHRSNRRVNRGLGSRGAMRPALPIAMFSTVYAGFGRLAQPAATNRLRCRVNVVSERYRHYHWPETCHAVWRMARLESRRRARQAAIPPRVSASSLRTEDTRMRLLASRKIGTPLRSGNPPNGSI
jgi:hypothetical protein